jgi:hypothetical protein
MRTTGISLLFVVGSLALAQAPSDVFEKAPPAIDEALRARVEAFYQAHVEGKFRVADRYVAEDSKDAFFAADKPRYHGFQISKITYAESFTKATIVTACKTDMFFQGRTFPVTMPAVSHWKIDDGQWFWYYIQPSEMESPFGSMKAGPENQNSSLGAMMPRNFQAVAKELLSKVTMDRLEVSLAQDRSSRQEMHLKNAMIGSIKVTADPTGVPGLTVVPAKSEVGPGEEIAVVVEFNLEDPSILCRECLVHPGVRPPATVNLHVSPTQQEFPIKIVFTQQGPGK